ncbi:MAG: DUF1489 domain-containing protein [Henriciella sp.]|uniref:DUF1489 family protein n=1 Tax=Henriciella sp. TaxID=1968823 RepID=UPI0032EF5F0D
MVKLCVGADDVGDLEAWQKRLMKRHPAPVHHTRMVPKQMGQLLDGGSIYWVIKGVIQVRQAFTDIREIEDRGGRRACELVFDPELIAVDPTPKRPFQGWRYLKPAEAPADLQADKAAQDIPPDLHAKLKEAMVW